MSTVAPGGDVRGGPDAAVSRIWRAFGLKRHIIQTWKLSADTLFIDKVRDVVGLYMRPPENADIRTWISEWNKDPRPFIWTKTADEILETLAAYCERVIGSRH